MKRVSQALVIPTCDQFSWNGLSLYFITFEIHQIFLFGGGGFSFAYSIDAYSSPCRASAMRTRFKSVIYDYYC